MVDELVDIFGDDGGSMGASLVNETVDILGDKSSIVDTSFDSVPDSAKLSWLVLLVEHGGLRSSLGSLRIRPLLLATL